MVVSEALVVESEQVQDGGVEVMDGDHVLDGFVSELIGGPVAKAFFDTGSSHPAGKPGRVVVASLRTLLERRHATKFGAPDHQCVFQQAALTQVDEQAGRRLVEDRPVHAVLTGNVLVAIPVAHAFAAGLVGTIEELHESHPFFDEPAGEDAVACVGRPRVLDLGAAFICSVKAQDVFGLAG